MKLRSADLLAGYMDAGDFTQARLARFAGCSRQFIHMLLTGERSTCTPEVAKRIEEAMRVLPGTLFDAHESPSGRPRVTHSRTKVA